MSLLRYLKDPKCFEKNRDSFYGLFEVSDRKTLIEEANRMMNRMYPERMTDDPQKSPVQNINDITICMAMSASNSNHNLRDIEQEFNIYEKTYQKSENLKKLEKALLTIKPSSIESERIFSSVGRIVTKFRTRLSDENLNSLVILRQFYLSTENKDTS